MSTISLRLPDSLHRQLRDLASRDGISLNQFATTALAEKLAALMTEEYIEQRAKHGSREKFDRVLRKISESTEPEPEDAI